MKNIAIGLAILGVATAVLDIQEGRAADPYNPEVPETYEAPNYAFTGLSIGVDGGGQFTAIQINNPDGPEFFDGISADGLIGGANAEFLFAVDRFRLGVYAEGGWSNVNTEINFGPGADGDLLTQDHYYGGGIKAGFTVYGSTLIYGRAGYDWSQWSSDFADEKADVGSWLVGGGIQTMCGEHVSCGLGADYLWVNEADVDGFDATPFVEDSEMGRIKARLSYHF